MKTLKTKSIIILLSIILGWNNFSVAQVAIFDWAKIFAYGTISGSSGSTDQMNCVDAQGNIYVAGTFNKDNAFVENSVVLTFPQSDPLGIYVAKFNTNGDLLWQKTGGYTYPQNVQLIGIAVDSQNKLYVGLGYKDTLNYDGNQFIENAAASNIEYAAFCIDKLDGSFISKTIISTTSSYYDAKMDVNSSDELVTVYRETNSLFIKKFDNTSSIILNKNWSISGSTSGLEFVAFDASQNSIFIAGNFNNNFSISTASFNNTLGNSWAIRFDNLGDVTWSLQCKASGASSIQTLITSISEENNGNFYVLGHFTGTATFTGTTQTVSGGEQLFYAKYNSAGNLIWLKQSTGQGAIAGRRIKMGTDNKLYLMGNLEAAPMFLGGDSTLQTLVINSSDRCFLAQMDTAGNTLWLKRVNNAGGIQDVGDRRYNVDMFIDSISNIYFTGSYNANTSLMIGSFTLPNYSFMDNKFFFAKTTANPNPVGIIENLRQNIGGILIYPNPTNGKFQLNFEELSEPTTIDIYNTTGGKVYTKTTVNKQNEIDMSHLSKGLYFIRIDDKVKKYSKKIILQ